MRWAVPLLVIVSSTVAWTSPVAAESPDTPETLLVRDATLWTQGPRGKIENGDLLIRKGKVAKVGANLKAPAGAVVIDATGKHVTPGLFDAHSHTAIRGGVNEGSNNVTAEVRIADVIDPENINIYRQLAGGLTAANLMHGSANAIGGQNAVVKLKWKSTRDEMLIADAPAGIKFALGENPKRSNFRRPGVPQRYPATRMGVNASIRERFAAARDYVREWSEYESLSERDRERRKPPRRDLQLEAIAEILRGERLIHSHSYRQDEILALVRLAEEFDVTVGTFQHVLEGYKVADELRQHGAGASTFSDWWAYKLEAYDAIPYNGALMHERGVVVSFNSDSSELARRLNLEAAKAVKYGGVDEERALDFVTINPAKQFRIDHRIGSLEKGKDGDFVIWSGHPLNVYSIVEQTWVDGVRQFDRGADLEGRAEIAQRREALIEQIRTGGKKKDDDEEPNEGQEVPDTPTADAPANAGTAGAGEGSDDTRPRRERPSPRATAYVDRLAEFGGDYSIVHATVHTVSGETLEDGTVSFRKGRIVEVGAGKAPLPGAEVIDAAGKHVYPGLIDLNTAIGLTEIGSVAGSVDITETGDLNPNVTTAIAINPDSELIPVTRANGLTHVGSIPSGGLVSGTSTLIRLDGWTWEDVAAATPLAMHVRWPSFRPSRGRFFGPAISEEDQKKRREKALETIDTFFDDSRAYERARKAEHSGGLPLTLDPSFEAMLPVLDGTVAVVIHAGEIRQIKSAIEWADEQGIRFVIAGSGDLWRVADLLRDKQIPVILTSVLALPTREDEPYDVRYTEAARLHEAGVTFCFASSGRGFAAPMTRNLPYHAAMAAAFGLPREEALRAVTLYPARIMGLGDHLGAIEVGKSASLIITDGDPLEIRTTVERAFIDGRPVDLAASRHRRLYTRYRGRPNGGSDK